MRRIIGLLAIVTGLLVATAAPAQEQVWVQIEAQPTEAEGKERAAAYAAAFPDVQGWQLNSGWYAVALGPYDRAAATERLASLKRENLIPRDSYISDGRSHLVQFWPPAGGLPEATAPEPEAPEDLAMPEATGEAPAEEGTDGAWTAANPPADSTPEAPAPETAEAPAATPELPAIVEETPEEARESEAALSPEERMDLQRGLEWFGFYEGAIDGAFGRGTRASMAAWQEASGLEPTGILTSAQRAALLNGWRAEEAAYGFRSVGEGDAGIEVTLPMAMVAFDHYEPPFVHYAALDGSETRIILISQPGDAAALRGLYDLLQTLAIIPMDGERSVSETGFTIMGRNARTAAFAKADLSKGLIKGYIVVWNPADEQRVSRVLTTMEASFRAVGDRALDPGMVALSDGARQGLLTGLEVRRPKLSRSGFYLDAAGTVLTTPEAVEGCSRVTLDAGVPATVRFSDKTAGLAVLTPGTALAPTEIAELRSSSLRPGAEIAVSGYPYEDRLPAPVLTFGTLEAETGLNGETGLSRLTLEMRPGDAGGPVLDATGAVVGLLLPQATGGTQVLPAGTAFAASGAAIAARLALDGLTIATSDRVGALPPDDLAKHASGMTVLVSCWE
ncbi:serine protease [Neotabrizicola shimadae]|uniref:Peptidoglycan-binding protein n=1 Tax=Neotabrizicola shimadae TaxID=2807096 RepID=A0A8G0ZUP3_9RHOB|nr:serine protease [Neotabrizicola shimadae]QYZ68394.1 peptidoglycan-binding protein [Neotabrizicola shimadae]